MKIEFTVALSLLALGCLLWTLFGYRSDSAGSDQLADTVEATNGLFEVEVENTARRFDETNVSDEKMSGRDLLLKSAGSLSTAGPIEAAAQLSVHLFGQHIVADGRYYQMGQGRGRARLEFVYGDQKDPSTVLQICDGQFYYRYESRDGKANLEFADLSKLAETDQHILLADSGTWMATGGLPSLLKHLANHFDFEPVRESTIGEVPVLVVRGHWNEDMFRRLMFGQINQNFIQDKIRWDKLPANLPHAIEIELGNDSFFPLFPYRISFYRNIESKEKKMVRKKIVTMSLHEVIRLDQMADEIFRIEKGSMKLNNVTPDVVERIRDLNRAVRSAELEIESTQKR